AGERHPGQRPDRRGAPPGPGTGCGPGRQGRQGEGGRRLLRPAERSGRGADVNGQAVTHPCAVFALRRESLFFRRSFPPRPRVPGAPCRAYLAGPPRLPFLVLETGLGAHAMESAADWLLSGPRVGGLPCRPPWVVLAGFSGALQPGLPVGHLVLATEILDEQ